jgi:peptidyl-prolyl cis-trans isomerase A (cyclophilin A)
MIPRRSYDLFSRTFPLALRLCLVFLGASACGQARHAATSAKAEPLPTGPTVLIDTTLGRVRCKLFLRQAPVTVANFIGLAEGSKDWTDNASGTGVLVHGKPFYDGVAFFGIADGISTGDRLGGGKGLAGPAFPAEKNSLTYERDGRLIMARVAPVAGSDKSAPEMTSSSLFYLLGHGSSEFARRGGTVFGQCDEASLPVITAIDHTLLSRDNYPLTPIAVNHITVLRAGEPEPPLATNVPPAAITPQPPPMPVADIPAPEPTGPTAIMDVTINGKPAGQLTCRLFKDEAPIATANFIGLVNGTKDWKSPATHVTMHGKRFYDGLTFKRIIPDFMIQNADMPGSPAGGDIGFKFDNEIVPGLTFDRPGRLAYANAGPGTNSSEFFITEHAVRRLSGNYTIFGQCDDASVKLVETIARVPRDTHNKPLSPVVIRRITIVPAAK